MSGRLSRDPDTLVRRVAELTRAIRNAVYTAERGRVWDGIGFLRDTVPGCVDPPPLDDLPQDEPEPAPPPPPRGRAA